MNLKKKKEVMFNEITTKMFTTYQAKNSDYGDSFTKVRNQHPNAILIRLADKYNRLEALLTRGNQQVKDESIDDTLIDMANYCILELIERQYEQHWADAINSIQKGGDCVENTTITKS